MSYMEHNKTLKYVFQGILVLIFIDVLNNFLLSLVTVISVKAGISLSWTLWFQVIYYLIALYLIFFYWKDSFPEIKWWAVILVIAMCITRKDFYIPFSSEETIFLYENNDYSEGAKAIAYFSKLLVFIFGYLKYRKLKRN